MENISAPFLSELEMEDPFFSINEREMDWFNELTTQQIIAALGQDFQHSFSFESNSCYPTLNPRNSITANFSGSSMEASQAIIGRPTKLPKIDDWNSCTTQYISTPEAYYSSTPTLVCFGYPNSQTNPQIVHGNLVGAMRPEDIAHAVSAENMTVPSDILIAQGSFGKQDHVFKANRGTKTRSPSQTQEHILSERNRREKLTELFIALSATIPGLKKMDKSSVLGDAVKYLEQLQQKVKTLEEQIRKDSIESSVVVNKSQIMVYDETHSSVEITTGRSDEMHPEIEARVSGKHILLNIHCDKRKGFLVKTFTELEKLHLTIVNSSVIEFGISAIHLTIIAQIENDFSMTVEDLVRNLRSSFLQFMRKEEACSVGA
ncbi:hypothetical protein HHK36_004469 [Tetracentron sinense]|uniref:BHLH domain-containing protein n=1 Tax=Tetracentron sinense TaxID=13715 RepID=A0A834ZR85_TETSI|nr:hypothetical protein HHK36_004469 [Tetracentron sinense]